MTRQGRAREGPRLHWARWGIRRALPHGIAPRLAALLTVALLPLGLIAVGQTRSLAEEASRRSGLSLLLLTREAALPIQRSVEQAIGAAGALAVVAGTLEGGLATGGTCEATLAGFTAPASPYAFVGIVPRGGAVACSTRASPFQVPDPARLAGFIDDPRPRVMAGRGEGDGVEDALIVSTPYGAAPDGLVALSLRRGGLAFVAEERAGPRPVRLAVFNDEGEVLAEAAGEDGAGPLPGADVELVEQVGREPRVFSAEGAGGESLVVTVAPLIPGTLYAMAVWPRSGPPGAAWASTAVLFPIGMWLASLLVAFWAANRLVVRPMSGLVGRMRRFGADRYLPAETVPDDAPRELREIEAAFRQTAYAILQDEARMENAFRERGVLLREIHHRVKNNLQLISSIISMQMRRTSESHVRVILRRLQDRVLTLAAIYRSLYTSNDVSEASVAPILRTIVEQEVARHQGRVSISVQLDELVLDADKAVPLAFLLAEAVSNAVLQAVQASGERRVGVLLRREDGAARLEVVNSVPQRAGALGDVGAKDGGAPDEGAEARAGPSGASAALGGRRASSGLGSHLIAAFTAQLAGQAETGMADGLYRLAVTFPLDDEPAAAGERAFEAAALALRPDEASRPGA